MDSRLFLVSNQSEHHNVLGPCLNCSRTKLPWKHLRSYEMLGSTFCCLVILQLCFDNRWYPYRHSSMYVAWYNKTTREKNYLIQGDEDNGHASKPSRRNNVEKNYFTTMYSVRGISVCFKALLAVTYILSVTLVYNAADVVTSPTYTRYHTNRSQPHKGKIGLQTVTVIGFFQRFVQINYLLCPTELSESTDDLVLRLKS